MLSFLPPPVIGFIAWLLLAASTLTHFVVLFFPVLLKLIIPYKPSQVFFTKMAILIAESWIGFNNFWIRLTQKADWDVQGLEGLSKNGWYLVTSNHQSWVDIFVLQNIFNRRIPMLKFFLKQELIWVPIMGLAWWGLDFPFMKRYSKEYLAKHPEMRGKDLETTRKACEKFQHTPVSVMNFVEGTRFTPAKHERQGSPYQHLLKPRPGGTAFVIDAMGHCIDTLVDVTIDYPGGIPTFSDFMCGRVRKIVVRVNTVKIPEQLFEGDFSEDASHRDKVKVWLDELWENKDKQLVTLKQQ
ncbi:MAG: acyltransferase [Pseudomonadales bacterium]|uniref:Phospholipid/glycerol acyltransferase n=1 Tax=Oleiphilus messinensis TaxID=141451 RepID=A0A1Y0IEL5_9GAMM|nr:acyltransferase [Oleiphilus messinensis]ARU58978.1 phospholipid/glycerol acyltransferase [Oleiphilus messinensis]MCG8609400.1 acyltransferase [Pseudomonadales bacterium]